MVDEAMKTMLSEKEIVELYRLSSTLNVDTSQCSTKADIVTALLNSSGAILRSEEQHEEQDVLLTLRDHAAGSPLGTSCLNWGASTLLAEWDKVTPDLAGRVVRLEPKRSFLGGEL